MQHLKLFTLFFIISFVFCKNKKHDNAQSNVAQATDMISSQKEAVDISNLDYEIQHKMIDSAWASLSSQIPKMNVKALDKPFYKHLEGTFMGHKAVLNFNYHRATYDGVWVISCSLYDYVDDIGYRGFWRDQTKNDYLTMALDDEKDKSFQIRGAFSGNTFSGVALNMTTLQNFPFQMKEQNTDGSIALDLTECFMKEEYKGNKPSEDSGRIFHIVFTQVDPLIKSNNKAEVFEFLKDSLKIDDKCAQTCLDIKSKGTAYMSETFKENDHSRNSEYSIVKANTVYWNDDNLLVVENHYWDNTALISYGGASVDFETYDVLNKKKLIQEDVFIKDFEQNKDFNIAVSEYIGRTENAENLNANITNGFTPKGFYIAATGNHGWYVTPIFIPYQIVEPFLKEDFKKKYWKK